MRPFSTRIILIMALGLVLHMMEAQRPFAPLGAEWKYYGWVDGDCEGRPMFKFSVENDTTIQDRYCTMISRYIWNSTTEVFDYLDSLIISDDNGKVSFYHDDFIEQRFYPLYDFKAEPGDTLRSYNPTFWGDITSPGDPSSVDFGGPRSSLVTSTDTAVVDGIMYKRIYSASLDEECLPHLELVIESIGPANSAIVGSPCAVVAAGCFGTFVCYSDPAIEYLGSEFESCDFTTGTNNRLRVETLTVYPNPTSGRLKLENVEEHEIELVTVTGASDSRQRSLAVSKWLNLSGYPSGVYLVIVTLKSGIRMIGRVAVID